MADSVFFDGSDDKMVFGIGNADIPAGPITIALVIKDNSYDGLALDPDQIEHNYDPFDLAAGDTIQGFASTAATVVLTITGYEVPA